MRLFAAVLPPKPMLDELATVVEELHRLPGAGRLRWTNPGGWHLVLTFFGDVPPERVPELRERLARVAARRSRHELWLSGGGRFAQRVLWAGVDGEVAVLRGLAAATAAAARRSGIALDDHRPYHPHLTIARGRDRVDLAPYAAALADVAGTPWTVGEFTLLRSHLPAEGIPGQRPRYEPLASYPLRPAAPGAAAGARRA
ncbi:RNA 2',3'-cyclic phosphodiesterase [Streptomyces sp. 8K308]|nr:RNA 2',3'-cyclic phosphodiesterase [Streptomyces sp. 8K308]TDC22229.1 RNA 2',3'-cyclic phosphodiesterase [Streptomyces sp. 8K308]